MSSEFAIRAEGIGKRYRIGATQGVSRYRSLREDIAELASRRRSKVGTSQCTGSRKSQVGRGYRQVRLLLGLRLERPPPITL